MEGADIIDFNTGILFVTNPEMKAATTSPTSAFLELPEVQAALQQLMTADRDLNDMLGSKLLNAYVFTKSEAKNGRVGAYSCSCDFGGSGCTLGSKSVVLVGSVTYCNATVCRVCTLRW